MRAALLALFATSLLGCTIGPLWSPRVAGRIVDKETGQPVVGAVVSATWGMNDAAKWEGGSHTCCYRVASTLTDAEGRFELPGRVEIFRPMPLTWLERNPDLTWIHPAYGMGSVSRDSEVDRSALELEVVRNEAEIARINASGEAPFCYGSADCWQACRVWYGGDEACFQHASWLRRSHGKK